MTGPNTQAPPANPYDGKPFTLKAINDAAPGSFYFIDANGVVVGRIEACFHGSRYGVDGDDKGDGVKGPHYGDSAFYVQTAYVGDEMKRLRALLGGAPAGTDNWPDAIAPATHDDGSPMTAEEFASFRGPVAGGPNDAPDLAPTLRQVGNEIEKITPAAPVVGTATPANQTVVASPDAHVVVPASTTPIPAGPVVIVAHTEPTVHESLLKGLESHAVTFTKEAAADLMREIQKLRDKFAAAVQSAEKSL